MEKDLSVAGLFEVYKELLTEKQRNIFSAYYMYDLSLSEIAESEGTTRQSVSEALKKVKDKLNGFEKKLRLKEITDNIYSLSESVSDEELAAKLKETIGI